MSKFKSSWILMKQSCAVLLANKKLLLFPAITSFLILFILLFFLSGVFLRPTGHSYSSEKHWKEVFSAVFVFDDKSKKTSSIYKIEFNDSDKIKNADNAFEASKETHKSLQLKSGVFILWAIGYFISMILITFFNTAFYNEIIHALNGQPVSISGGLKFAFTRIKSILLWSLLAATVGIILKKIEEQFGFVGRFVVGLIGIAWSVASVFAIPIIIRSEEGHNPLKVLKTSGLLIKEKWGEGLIGYVGINSFALGFSLFSTLLCGLIAGLLIWQIESPILILVGMGCVWLITITSISYIQSIVNQIFQCALYIYASEGALPESFSVEDEVLEKIWKIKKK